MRQRPILFAGEMVRAILEGRKTQTRRVVKLRDSRDYYVRSDGHVHWFRPWDAYKRLQGNGDPLPSYAPTCPYGVPGDRLWVRETFCCDHCEYPGGPVHEMQAMLDYRATHDCGIYEAGCPCSCEGRSSWRPSIHMPRWASRITLEVTGVRLEPLHDLSEEDAIAEGIEAHDDDGVTYYGPLDRGHCDPVVAFRAIWDSINAKRGHSWRSTPWVWVVEFRPVEGGDR